MHSCAYFCTFMVLSFCLSSYTALSKLPSLKPNAYSSKKIDECRACKILVDSFEFWRDSTSRGKFEGGDADWEENKLKTYARSEVRLVEIQEGLCSELKRHKDECYSLAEEAEQPIEEWWVENNPAAADLYTWLCIDTLAHCCPLGHFGPDCSQCVKSISGDPCGGRGKCNGNGTRKGTGKCQCRQGYDGDACDSCALNFFQLSSKLEQLECGKCDVSCDINGPGGCLACASGWTFMAEICVDVDECAQSATCSPDQYCVNTVGSYSCHVCDETCESCTGPGSNACVLCREGYFMNYTGTCSEAAPLTLIVSVIGLIISIYMVFKKIRFIYVIAVLISLLSVLTFYLPVHASSFSKFLSQYYRNTSFFSIFHSR